MNKPVILSEDTLAAPIVVDAPQAPPASTGPAFAVIGAISVSHMLNDLMQSLIPSVYPILKDNYALDFGQIGSGNECSVRGTGKITLMRACCS